MKRYNEFTTEQLNQLSNTDVLLNLEIHQQKYYHFNNEAFYWESTNELTSAKFKQRAEVERLEWCLWSSLYHCRKYKKKN